MKGQANKVNKNIKPMAGGNAIAQLQVGGWVFGTKGPTDLTDFNHYYKPDGTKVELGKPCKVTHSDMILTNEEEWTDPVDPPVDPPTPPVGNLMQQRYSNDNGRTWSDWTYWIKDETA